MKEYKRRIADSMLKRKLAGKGAVLIEGPKGCGKTTTAAELAGSEIYMSDPSQINQNLGLAEIDPSILLRGETPRLIDEWQIATNLWDAVRFEVDKRNDSGQFILTGSSVPSSTKNIIHTGTGRISRFQMRTMSLFESLESSGDVSLLKLFDGSTDVAGVNPVTSLEQLAFLSCRGGWPFAVDIEDKSEALKVSAKYTEDVIHKQISDFNKVKRNADKFKLFMKAYAKYQGSQASAEVIRQDMIANYSENICLDSVYSYIDVLKKIFVIEEMPAWRPKLRSKSEVRSTDTRYFSDPSIATSVLGLGPMDLISDLETFGLIFETMCVRDLRVYADALNGRVYHYRDKSGLECDAVIHLRNGKYGLIEVKLGGETAVEYGAENLKKLAAKIDTERMNNPSFMMVLTGVGSYAYTRKDGVCVVPIGTLAP